VVDEVEAPPGVGPGLEDPGAALEGQVPGQEVGQRRRLDEGHGATIMDHSPVLAAAPPAGPADYDGAGEVTDAG
jgi:hypothetical protein